MEGKTGISQKQAFGLGLLGGILVLCTIGFFVLLGIVLTKDGNSGSVVVNPTPTQQPPAGQPTQISVKDVDKKIDHIRGNAKADLTIVEFSDMDCPFCKNFHETMQQIMEKYSDDVRWVYRHFPLDSLHPNARTKANASECAGDQGKFWEYMDANFDSGLSDVNEIAKQAGVPDIAQFEDCVSKTKFASKVQADEQDGIAAGAQGTPYSVLIGPDGETIPVSGAQPYANVEATIQQFLD